MQQSNETVGMHITTYGSGDLIVLIHVDGVEGHDRLGMYGMNLVSEAKEIVVGPIHMHSR
jgi:hypothetical protein